MLITVYDIHGLKSIRFDDMVLMFVEFVFRTNRAVIMERCPSREDNIKREETKIHETKKHLACCWNRFMIVHPVHLLYRKDRSSSSL